MIVYKSKVGVELVLPIALILLPITLLFAFYKIWFALGLLLVVNGFVLHLFLNTNYTIKDNLLFIKSGFFNYKPIQISSIKKIVNTNNPISSPATSLKRILISYNKFDSIIISPKNKDAFIAELLKINPKITL